MLETIITLFYVILVAVAWAVSKLQWEASDVPQVVWSKESPVWIGLTKWYGYLNGIDVSTDDWIVWYVAIYKLFWYFGQKDITFVEFVTVIRINASLF